MEQDGHAVARDLPESGTRPVSLSPLESGCHHLLWLIQAARGSSNRCGHVCRHWGVDTCHSCHQGDPRGSEIVGHAQWRFRRQREETAVLCPGPSAVCSQPEMPI